MKAAVVTHKGQPPVYMDFDAPHASEGHTIVDVTASALSQITRGRASGAHYSSSGVFPFVAGMDGVGRTQDGQRVYFFAPHAPFGALAQRTCVPDRQCFTLPDSLDDVTAAAIAIPGMSSWAALTERAKFVAGETVLVNGATGASGTLAVQIAKHLGAARVIATGRHAATLDALTRMGADHVISLDQDEAGLTRALAPHWQDGVHIVLDYLWGSSARALLVGAAQSLPEAWPMRFVQIGSIGGQSIDLPGAVLRASAVSLLGSGIGSIAQARLFDILKKVLEAAVPAQLRMDLKAVSLSDLASYWSDTTGHSRIVFVP